MKLNKTKGVKKEPKRKTLKKKKKLIIMNSNNTQQEPPAKMSPKPSAPYNKSFIAILEQLNKIMLGKGEVMRARAYQKAIQSIMAVEGNINSADDIKGLKGVGKTIVDKFNEFVKTGTLSVIEREKNNPVLLFSEVYGIGPKKAKDLVEKGIKTIAQLRENKKLLNDKQLIGLEHYEDILKRIPRSEIQEYEKHFAGVFSALKQPTATFSIVGSYRRGASDSGDIDLIITDSGNDSSVLQKFVAALIDKKIILHKLTDGKTKILVVTQLPGKPARRVDFLYSSPTEFPFAQLYFTGSKTFNTLMRQRALDMGYTLNEHGIYHMVSGKKGALVDNTFATEKDIFTFLKMEYKEPKSRLGAAAIVDLKTPPKVEVPAPVEPAPVEPAPVEPTPVEPTPVEPAPVEPTPVEPKKRTRCPKGTRKNPTTGKCDDPKNIKKVKTPKKKSKKQKLLVLNNDPVEAPKVEALPKVEAPKVEAPKVEVPKVEALPKVEAPKVEAPKVEAPKVEALPKVKAPIIKKKPVVSSKTHLKNFQKKGVKYLNELDKEVLKKALQYATDLYHNEPEKVFLSDNEFDVIKEYYDKKFEPFVEIGAPIKQDKAKVTLPYPMPSMDKIKPSTNALEKWLTKYNDPTDYVISGKLDGISGLYVVKNGEKNLYTRGDGEVGQDISGLIPYLKLPQVPKDHKDKTVVIRGEFIISKENFEKHFKDTGAKNARNTVSGIIGRKTVDPASIKHVDFVAYELMKPEMKISEQLAYISKLTDSNVVKHSQSSALTNEMLSDMLVDFRTNYKYETDGIIVAHNKLYSVRKNKNPEHAFAFKMVVSDQVIEAKVVDVIWTPSKDGYLKPRVRIEPVEVGGVTIEYATGFNAAFIEKNKIGVGALIQIVRSGDVIPDIKKVVVPAAEPLMPDVPYVWGKTHVDIMLTEENKAKDPTVKAKNIAGFFKILETEGLSSGTVDRLIAAGYDDVCKIIPITKEQLLKLDGFKEKKATKIHKAINEALTNASPILIMKASNIFGRGFGERRLEPIFEKYPDILVSKESPEAKIAKVAQVQGIATLTATTFVNKIPEFMAFIKKCGLEDRFIATKTKKGSEKQSKNAKEANVVVAPMIVKEKKGDPNHPLYGKSVMFSGFRPKELIAQLLDVGGKLGSSVSKKTFALVVKDKDDDSGKITKAKSLGIPVMNGEEFQAKYFK